MDSDKAVGPQVTGEQLQAQQISSNSGESKKNYWKLGFFVVLLLWLLSAFSLVAYFKNSENGSTEGEKELTNAVPTTNNMPNDKTPTTSKSTNTPLLDVGREISVRIEPYRLDEEQSRQIATFQIINLNEKDKLDKVTYWTDKNGACKATTQPFTEFVKVPVDEANYSFFRLTDADGKISEIYASSHNPIFQCGNLAE
jgi:hypothetical protein